MNQIRQAVRALARNPAFSVAAVVALALGIGANTSVFSVVNAILLRPLPYDEAERVVRVYNRWEGSPRAAISPAEHFDYADRTADIFDAYGVWSTGAVNVTGGGEPERVSAAFLSAGVLTALGVTPVSGRAFTAAEDDAGSDVALVTDAFVQRRFGGAAAVGRTLVINGTTFDIIGVLPPDFRLPDQFASPTPAELVLPIGLDRAAAGNRGSHFLQGVARLAPGVDRTAAQAALEGVAADFVATWPDDYPRDMRFGAHLMDVRETIVGAVRPVLLLLLAAVGLVLLVTCANVASLLLARADGRRREFAVRIALGAGRGRIAHTVFAETAVLAAFAGLAGVVLASWGTSALVSLMPSGLSASVDVSIDPRVLSFAIAVTLCAAVLASFAPLAGLGRLGRDAQAVLRDGGRGSTPSAARQRLRRALVTAEVAVAVVLLVGAGLLLRSFAALLAVDPGYDVEDVLTTRISLPSSSYPEDADRRDFFAALTDRLAGLSGVASAGAVTNLPLASSLGDLNFRIEGRPMGEGEVSPRADWQVVTPGYFDAIGMRLLHGRGITAADDERAPGAVVFNESAARLYFGDERSALGRRLTLGGNAGPGMVTIVGIVADIRHGALDAEPLPEMYLAHRQFTFWNGGSAVATMQVVARTSVPPTSLARALRTAVRELDPALPIGPLTTMRDVESASLAQPRFLMVLIGAFAALALLLAAVGLYGLIAYMVGQRQHEIGVRMALGARRSQVVGMVLRQGMAMVGLGVVLGLASSFALTRSLRGMLFGVAPTDPGTLVAVAAVLLGVGALACLMPARRAAGLAPGIALRTD